jgi:hypothetical protein
VRDAAGPHDSMLSSGKASRLLGYAPQHTWRNEV